MTMHELEKAIAAAVPEPVGDDSAAPALEPLLARYRNRHDEINGDFHILVSVLRIDPTWAGRLRLNAFSNKPELQGALGHWQPITDSIMRGIRTAMHERYRIVAGAEGLHQAILTVAESRSVDPLKDYVFGLLGRWDGKKRLRGLFNNYFIPSATHPLYEVYALKWSLMAIHRALHPGSAAQTMLVFQGEQGKGKSRGVAALFSPEWFGVVSLHPGDKDTVLTIQGKWACEVAEMAGMSKADVESMKMFITMVADEVRAPYGRVVEIYPRRVIFIATTNGDSILGDPTGSRRYWVIGVDGVDVDAIARDRDQLWAEAYHYYVEAVNNDSLCYWLTDEEEGQRAELAIQYEDEEVWAPEVMRYLQTRGTNPTTLRMIIESQGLGEANDMSLIKRLGNRMRAWGYVKRDVKLDGIHTSVWSPGKRCRIKLKSGRPGSATPSPTSDE